MKSIQKAIAKVLDSGNGIPLALKQRTSEIILHACERHTEPFGLFVILGWRKRWQGFAITSDRSQDLFQGRNIHHPPAIGQHRIATTRHFDGAILVNKDGEILHSGVMLEGLRPREAAAKLNPGNFDDLSEQFGFNWKVHTRHLTAITASFQFPGTTVFTVSEETRRIHIFENGRILYASPHLEV
ncbi:MAG: diadenylate cyclase [Candidatus Kaiserbacteria bacterium]|nr:diadenylate cyclase [Candidatus Kaiserbacteria bacterium]